MATSGLPLDICVSIINEIARDLDTLKACSLVCRHLAYISQKRLFSVIAINAFLLKKYPSTRRIWLLGTPAALKDILKESPHLANHIRSLTILDQYYFPQSSDSDTDGRTTGMTWLPRDRYVPDILPLLQDLVSLEVHFGAFCRRT
ncbi:hypothetical protein CPB83DRAFT_212507 [Crepidotus variabilis]|uniref:F-box domain-containing protein n=1 Tax=Crepidotus variabilis TaxID=179855 RepID=A0A9P6JW95_9AGAR|nr:hypothetical protein CPB83DRAFT_212507 [Crepidotus variabilis]